ncbi:MAG: O-methyltransferase [Longimicrobiales bacterium]|nr:O-methyltransferase [Longimicrobiales bacterium]
MSGDRGERLSEYVSELFAEEGEVLEELRGEIGRRGLPEIHISAEVGRLLQVLLTAVGAERVLEVGTLGGYSALWMARALPSDGRLVTLEIDPDRAALAREFIDRAGQAEVVEVRVGDARALMAEMVEVDVEPYDAVFIDADKESYVEYLDRSLELVRPGGLILADNAFRDGRVLDDDPDEATLGVLDYNQRVAEHDRLVSTILPVRDGVTVSIVGV